MGATGALVAIQGVKTVYDYNISQEQADYQNRMSRMNAQFAELQKRQALKIGEEKAQRYTEQVNSLIASQKTAYASSGIDISTGTAMKVMEETRNLGLEDAMNIRNNAFLEAMGFQHEQNQWLTRAQQARQAGQVAGFQTLLGGGLSVANAMNKSTRTTNELV